MQKDDNKDQTINIDELMQMFDDFDYDINIGADTINLNVGCYSVGGD